MHRWRRWPCWKHSCCYFCTLLCHRDWHARLVPVRGLTQSALVVWKSLNGLWIGPIESIFFHHTINNYKNCAGRDIFLAKGCIPLVKSVVIYAVITVACDSCTWLYGMLFTWSSRTSELVSITTNRGRDGKEIILSCPSPFMYNVYWLTNRFRERD